MTRENFGNKLLEESNDRLKELGSSITGLHFDMNKRRYNTGEKITVYYLFQFPSFYPSTKTLMEVLKNDEQIDFKVLVGSFNVDEKVLTKNVDVFLNEKGIEYDEFDIELLYHKKPHIMILQSPYDNWHRPNYLSSFKLKEMGIRIVYVPYGIEISDVEKSRELHFKNDVVINSWKVYTFSERMKEDYITYGNCNPYQVVACGHPKFDGMFNAEITDVDPEILQRSKNRKIVVWKLHFPYTPSDKNGILTPDFSVYKVFGNEIPNMKDLFFVIMLHPKYYEIAYKKKIFEASFLMDRLRCYENVYIHENADYQAEIKFGDFLIIDRSAVLIEAIASQKPVLYMVNDQDEEPLTEAVLPIVESYYKGKTAEDMFNFIEMCQKGNDTKKAMRQKVLEEHIHYDGLSGQRIKDNIVQSMKKESDWEKIRD